MACRVVRRVLRYFRAIRENDTIAVVVVVTSVGEEFGYVIDI